MLTLKFFSLRNENYIFFQPFFEVSVFLWYINSTYEGTKYCIYILMFYILPIRSLWDGVQGAGSQDRRDRRDEEGADRSDGRRSAHVRAPGDLAAPPPGQIQPSQHCPIDRHLPRTAV